MDFYLFLDYITILISFVKLKVKPENYFLKFSLFLYFLELYP